jgi:hypothetical protein
MWVFVGSVCRHCARSTSQSTCDHYSSLMIRGLTPPCLGDGIAKRPRRSCAARRDQAKVTRCQRVTGLPPRTPAAAAAALPALADLPPRPASHRGGNPPSSLDRRDVKLQPAIPHPALLLACTAHFRPGRSGGNMPVATPQTTVALGRR